MAKIQTLKKNGESIYPMTHMKGVVDDNGNTMDVLLAEAEKRALRKLFVAAGAEYNDTDQIIQKIAPWETEEKWRLEDDGTYTYWEEEAIVDHLPGHYYLNGLGDITEEEMSVIYVKGETLNIQYNLINFNGRTNLKLRSIYTTTQLNCYYYAQNAKKIESLNLTVGKDSLIDTLGSYNTERTFGNCFYLKNVICNYMRISNGLASNTFMNAERLEYILLNKAVSNINLQWQPNFRKDCVLYAIQNAVPTTAITITLHHDAYVRIANQPDVLEALTTKNAELASKGGSISLICATHPEEVTLNT